MLRAAERSRCGRFSRRARGVRLDWILVISAAVICGPAASAADPGQGASVLAEGEPPLTREGAFSLIEGRVFQVMWPDDNFPW